MNRWGAFNILPKWFRLHEEVVDRSPRMERNKDNSARVAGEPTSKGVLTRGQMARALREAARGETRSGGTGEGVTTGAISRVNVRKYINNKYLRTGCGGVTLAMLMAAAITVAPTAGNPRNSANVPSSGPQPAGSIPRTPSPSVGDGNSVHPYVSDVNQGHQKKMLNKITSVTAAAVVGIAATVNAQADLYVPSTFATIQAAINAAQSGDRILVSPGIYHEQLQLNGKGIMIVGSSGGTATIVHGDDLRPVVIGSGEPSSCIIQGLTFTHGRDVSSSGGGGVSLRDSAAQFRQCRFVENVADGEALWSGGGLFAWAGDVVLEDCDFISNKGRNQSSASAIYHYGGGSMVVRRCKFIRNIGNFAGDTGTGLGSTIKFHSSFTNVSGEISGCAFVDNGSGLTVADPNENSGEISIYFSGAMVTISNCSFEAASLPKFCAVMADLGAHAILGSSRACGYPAMIYGAVTVTDSLVTSCADCNSNGVADLTEILTQQIADTNNNNIPDTCECIGDIDLDGAIGGSDLGIMLAYWGPVTTESVSLMSDLNADGFVNGSDLSALLAHWGACQG